MLDGNSDVDRQCVAIGFAGRALDAWIQCVEQVCGRQLLVDAIRSNLRERTLSCSQVRFSFRAII